MIKKTRLGIKYKMLLFILSASFVVYLISIGYISINFRNIAYNDAIKFTDVYTREYSKIVENQLDEDIAKIRTLVQSVTNYKRFDLKTRQEIHGEMYYNVFKDNPQWYGIWDSWELSVIDSTWDKDYGRYVIEYYRMNNKIKHNLSFKCLDGDNVEYARLKANKEEAIDEPYLYSYTGNKEDEVLMTSLIVPLLENGKYTGLIGVDISLESIQEITDIIKPFEGSYSTLISHQGVFVTNPDKTKIGKSIYDDNFTDIQKKRIKKSIENGEHFSFTHKSINNKEEYISIVPLQVGRSTTPWALSITVPVDIILFEANKTFLISILVGILGLLFLSTIIWLIARNISKPLIKTKNILDELSNGNIEKIGNLKTNANDEISDMVESVNKLVSGLEKTAEFAKEIGKGNLDAKFEILSKQDTLGNALLEMRKNLQHAEEEEKKRKIEDEKQNWLTQGLAKFGDILRKDNDNLEILSYNIINQLVDYLGVNQGAIFVLNDTDENNIYYEATAAIAYNRNKHIVTKYKPGEDLVGRCAHEKLPIYITNLPEDYIEITSGMGTANPSIILLVPLILNDVVYGVIEIASFNEIEKHKIDFLEKLGGSIASTISSVRVNQRTADLLEQSQSQSEELSSQEEEMRQNLEELQTTQEEASRREFETQGLIKALSSSTLTVEYDTQGRIIDINERYSTIVGIPRDQIIGLFHKDGIDFSEKSLADYNNFWEDLRSGIPKKEINKISYNEKEMWLSETYTPLLDQNENVYKILKIAFDITELKTNNDKLEIQEGLIEKDKKELEIKIAELSSVKAVLIQKDKKQRDQLALIHDETKFVTKKYESIKAIFEENQPLIKLSEKAEIISVNEIFTSVFSITEEDIINKKISAFYDPKNQGEFSINEILEQLKEKSFVSHQRFYIFNNISSKYAELYYLIDLNDDDSENEDIIIYLQLIQLEQQNTTKETDLKLLENIKKLQTEINLKNKEIESIKSSKQETVKIQKKPSSTKSKNSLVTWQTDFEINITELDEQHKNIIELSNQLYLAFRNDKSKKEIKDILKSLVDYASYHFGNEESYFKEFKFKFSEEHITDHKLFIKELQQFQSNYASGKVKFLDDIMTFIEEWILNHFVEQDQKYKQLFKEKGL